MALYDLQMDTAHAHFDTATRIVYITYRGELSAESSGAVYAWLQVLFISEGVDSIYGEIFDFRQVEEFSPDNLMNARQKSRTMNLRMDTRRLPVAMVVNDVFQEQILRGPMRNVPENPRKRIVETIEDAHAFLHEWHELNNTEAS